MSFKTKGETMAAMAVTVKWLERLIRRFEEGIVAQGLVIEKKAILRHEDGDVEPVLKVKVPGDAWSIELRLGNTLAEFLTLDREEVPLRFDPRLLDDTFAEKKLNDLVKSRLEIARMLATSHSPKEVRGEMEELGKHYAKLRMWEVLDDEKHGGKCER